jgi:hypothetical protein
MIDERKRQEEEEEQARLKAEWEKNNPSSGSYSHQSTTNSGGKKSNKYYGPANWYPPLDKSEEADLDISQKHIRGHLTLEDWPKLRKINVGNNELTNLTVYDCPELVWLNYAHNKFDSGVFAFIDKCPNLKEENIHNENCDGHYDWTQDLTEEERKKYEEQGKDPVRLLLEQTEHLTWEEILFELQKLGSSDQIDRNLAGIIAQIIKHKFETELIYIIIKYRDTKELSKEQFLEEIRIREPHFKSLLSDFTRSQLKRVLSSLTDKSYQSVSRNTSVWPWIFVGLGWVIFILIFNYLVIIRVKNRD